MNWLKLLFLKVIFIAIFMSSNVFGGGLEVSRQNNMILFDEGKSVSFSTRQYKPSVTDNLFSSSDNQSVVKNFSIFTAGYKSDYSENISYAFERYEPMASTLQYPSTVNGIPMGMKALLRSEALSLTGKYDISNSGFGVVAGVRQLTIKSSKLLLNPAQGELVTTADSGFGYMAGVSYEMPSIALKVLLTQAPGIDIVVPTTVVGSGTISQPSFTTLEFETGIAANTLLYGSMHQGEHGSAQVKLNGLGAISSFTDGEVYNIGVGRKFSDSLSASLSYTTEDGSSPTGTSPLSITNGTNTYALGINYSTEKTDISFGYAMSSFGDKSVTVAPYGTGNFTNNDQTIAGLRIKLKLQ